MRRMTSTNYLCASSECYFYFESYTGQSQHSRDLSTADRTCTVVTKHTGMCAHTRTPLPLLLPLINRENAGQKRQTDKNYRVVLHRRDKKKRTTYKVVE